MHANMMAEISFWRMTKQRTYDPGNIGMDPLVWFLKTFSVTQAVKHKAKTAFEIQL
jgi:hypothetical protein